MATLPMGRIPDHLNKKYSGEEMTPFDRAFFTLGKKAAAENRLMVLRQSLPYLLVGVAVALLPFDFQVRAATSVSVLIVAAVRYFVLKGQLDAAIRDAANADIAYQSHHRIRFVNPEPQDEAGGEDEAAGKVQAT